MNVLICLELLLILVDFSLELSSNKDHVYTNEFAVEIDGDVNVADLVAGTHNFRLVRQVKSLENVFHFIHDSTNRRSRRSAEDLVSRLSGDPNVRHVEQQRVLIRDKRSVIHDKQIELPIRHFDDKSVYQRVKSSKAKHVITTKDTIPSFETVSDFTFNDPYFKDQWYLLNRGQTGGTVGYDINVLPVWRKGITGRGVVVTILDDGIDHNHPDLKNNYDIEASTDLNDKSDISNDPVPNALDPSNSHGTRCAGEIAAEANNSNCCVGVAYNAKIGGVRMLDGPVTDLLEAEAVTFNNRYVDIYSASWGPTDDGRTMEGPHHYCQQALQQGISKGRGGKGSIFVWATGNGGSVGDDCSCDGYVSSIYTLSVGCISDRGLSTYFSEVCPSTMAVVFTGGSHHMPGEADYKSPKIKVVTTDLNGECTLEFQGTSSAAPLAAGCIALVLEANANLTWRDIQNIVVETARIPNDQEDGWTVNGGGHHVNHRFGFGALDCARMVEAAQSWVTVQDQHNCTVRRRGSAISCENVFECSGIHSGKPITTRLSVDACRQKADTTIDHLEHVQVHVVLEHVHRGDLSLILTSPAGTKSKLLAQRPLDDSADGIDFTFMTVHHWGEDPSGTWVLLVDDSPKTSNVSSSMKRGQFLSWSITLYGVQGERRNHKTAGQGFTSEKNTRGELARIVGVDEIKELMAVESESSDSIQIEDKQAVMKKTQEDQAYNRIFNEELNQEDVNFLHKLFATEEKVKDGRNEEVADLASFPVLRANKFLRDPETRLQGTDSEGTSQLRSSVHDGIRDVGKREKVEDDREEDLENEDDLDIDSLDKIIDDLSKFINNY